MGLLQNISNYFAGKGNDVSGEDTTRSMPSIYSVEYGQDFSEQKEKLLSSMQGWVYACVSAIADDISSVNIRLKKMNQDGSVEEIKDHPILDLLYKVNSYSTRSDHFWLTQAYLELSGEAPWFIDKDEKGNPIGIYLLRPDRLQIIPDKEKVIGGYKYTFDDGQEIPLSPTDVVFLKIPDPLDPTRGRATLQAALLTVAIENKTESWNYNFFNNSARPDMILRVTNEKLTPEGKDKLKKDLREIYTGTKNSHKLMTLFGKDIEVDKIGFAPKDMDFGVQQDKAMNKILSVFRVPKSILAQTDDVNFASAKVANYVFTKRTIKPRLERLVQQLNEFFVPLFKDTEMMFLDYDNPINEDLAEKSEYYEKAIGSGWMTINEVRELEGLEAIDGYDLPLVGTQPIINITESNGNVTTSENAEGQKIFNIKIDRKPVDKKEYISSERYGQLKARSKEYFKKKELLNSLEAIEKSIQDKSRDMAKKIINSKKKKLDLVKKNFEQQVENSTVDIRMKFWETKSSQMDTYYAIFLAKQIIIFRKQAKKVLEAFEQNVPKDKKFPTSIKAKNTKIDKILLDVNSETDYSVDELLPTLEKLYIESANGTLNFIGVDITFDGTRKFVKEWMKADARRFSKTVTETTNEELKKAIEDGLANNEGYGDIKKRIDNVFDFAQKNRSNLIARTETTRYSNQGSQQAMIDSGVIEEREWLAEPDACEFCKPLDGKKIAVADSFFKKGDIVYDSNGNEMSLDYIDVENPPLHPQCKCTTLPVIKISKGIKKVKAGQIVKRQLVIIKDENVKKEYDEKVKDLNEKINATVNYSLELREKIQKEVEANNLKKEEELNKKLEDADKEKEELIKLKNELIVKYNSEAKDN